MKVKRRQKRRAGFWKPGYSGNPQGASAAVRTCGTSVKQLLRQLFESKKNSSSAKTVKQKLIDVALRKAKRGDFFFWSKLIDLHEARLVSEDDLQEFIEKVYVTVRRHVEKLDGGKEALAEIAKDLQKENQYGP